MKSATTVRRVVLSFIGVFVAMIVAGPTLWAAVSATKSADYSLGVSPTSQTVSPTSRTVNEGAPASYTITVSPINGWSNPVTLTTSGVPAGASACFTPNASEPCNITSTTPPSSVVLTITGAPMRSTPYTITVNGQSGNGSTKHSVDLMLTVNAAASYSLSASPASVIVDPGASASYTVAIKPSDYAVSLGVSGLPNYATGTFSPSSSTTDNSSTLTVTTNMSKTPSGTFTLIISGTAESQALQSVQVSLVVSTAKGTPFGISGGIPAGIGELAPGKAPTPINLELENLNHKSISVTALSVAITVTETPGCTVEDFAVTQYSGPLPLTVPGDGTIHLGDTSSGDASLGVPSAAWPSVQLKNSALPQDGCKGAIVHLTYSGAANGN